MMLGILFTGFGCRRPPSQRHTIGGIRNVLPSGCFCLCPIVADPSELQRRYIRLILHKCIYIYPFGDSNLVYSMTGFRVNALIAPMIFRIPPALKQIKPMLAGRLLKVSRR